MRRAVPIPVPDERVEEARSRAMSDREREELLVMVVRSAARLLAEHPERQRIMRSSDPLPPSSIAALARLRRQARR